MQNEEGAQFQDMCPTCGGQIRIGDWPYCGGDASKHVHMDRFGDEPISPYVDENLCSTPVEIRTRGERRKIMDKLGIEPRDPKSYKAKRSATGRLFFDMSRTQ
jgi:hypothetical protein